jgi:hypothetical protein
MRVGIDRQHGEGELLSALGVLPFPVEAGDAHRHVRRLAEAPTHGLARFPVGLEE